MSKEIHVAINGCDKAAGTLQDPYRTISKAAKAAEPGDTVTVHEGEYREWVKPEKGGTSDTKRITYQAADGEKVIIKGSERAANWEKVEGTVWKAVIRNEIFGDYNPYAEEIRGDWLVEPVDQFLHTGEVYVNGKSFYEARTLDDLKNPVMRTGTYEVPWTSKPEVLLHPEDSIYQWYAQVDEEVTVIYANFHEIDPAQELVEINVRRSCFYPAKTGINYITVRGFEMAQAACPWTPPTADQPGLIGANWSKGWIIEDNLIHDAKCSAVSIGKEASTGHNLRTTTFRKSGYQNQIETVFRALAIGWSKENIGSHIIRRNTIHDCGQNAIVGNLGGVFSQIYDNHIYNIGVKHEFYGHEIAGIKLHAAIDVQIIHNNIHNCTLGVWLDWQAQGTRVSRNLFYSNDRDLFIEVAHGPHLIDNNIFASDYNIDNFAHGGAFIHNLFCGTMRRDTVFNRSTPYHFPHSVRPMGNSFVGNGDDRWYQNVFIGGAPLYTEHAFSGTVSYNGNPVSLEEYVEGIKALGEGDHDIYLAMSEPVYINRNVYLNGSSPFEREEAYVAVSDNPDIKIVTEGDEVYLEIKAGRDWLGLRTYILETKDLEMVRIAEAPFDDPNGCPIVFNTDINSNIRTMHSPAGPFAALSEGANRIRVWKKKGREE